MNALYIFVGKLKQLSDMGKETVFLYLFRIKPAGRIQPALCFCTALEVKLIVWIILRP
jgi:hypothetical protein